eukprot:1152560-Pelagomonas_calceolata.AAC.6
MWTVITCIQSSHPVKLLLNPHFSSTPSPTPPCLVLRNATLRAKAVSRFIPCHVDGCCLHLKLASCQTAAESSHFINPLPHPALPDSQECHPARQSRHQGTHPAVDVRPDLAGPEQEHLAGGV